MCAKRYKKAINDECGPLQEVIKLEEIQKNKGGATNPCGECRIGKKGGKQAAGHKSCHFGGGRNEGQPRNRGIACHGGVVGVGAPCPSSVGAAIPGQAGRKRVRGLDGYRSCGRSDDTRRRRNPTEGKHEEGER